MERNNEMKAAASFHFSSFYFCSFCYVAFWFSSVAFYALKQSRHCSTVYAPAVLWIFL